MRRAFIRMGVSLLLLAGIVALSATGGAYWHYRRLAASYEAELEAALAESRERVATLEAMVERLTRTRRLAQIVVSRQEPNEDTGRLETELLMLELDDQGDPIGRQYFLIPGSVAFFDGLVIKFDPESVAAGRPFRGHSVALLRRVYSEELSPREGIEIDKEGTIPFGYRTEIEPSEFERNLWDRFWEIADQPALASELGVRVAQGEAVYKSVRPGVLYELTIDAAGGLNLETRALPEAVAEILTSDATSGAKRLIPDG